MIALSPEPQTRLMVVADVVSGRPARNVACRAGAWPTPAWSTWPISTSSIRRGRRVEAGPFDGSADGDATELHRGDRGQRSAELADRRARRADDVDVAVGAGAGLGHVPESTPSERSNPSATIRRWIWLVPS